jgi:hypothetical protein
MYLASFWFDMGHSSLIQAGAYATESRLCPLSTIPFSIAGCKFLDRYIHAPNSIED